MTTRCFTHETIDCKTPGCPSAEGPVARANRMQAEVDRLYAGAERDAATIARLEIQIARYEDTHGW